MSIAFIEVAAILGIGMVLGCVGMWRQVSAEEAGVEASESWHRVAWWMVGSVAFLATGVNGIFLLVASAM